MSQTPVNKPRLRRVPIQTDSHSKDIAEEASPWATGRGRDRGLGSNRTRSLVRQTSVTPVQFIIVMLVTLVAVAVAAFFISRNVNGRGPSSAAGADAGPVVATVNGQPIHQRELDAHYEKEKEQLLGGPLLASTTAKGGITATRVLEAIKQDTLDKLINFEVIMQQARKEQLLPEAQEQKQLIETAKTADVKAGQTFEESLREHRLTEEQYNRNVISSAVYRVMAGKHMPEKGSDFERQNAFIDWICKARQTYDVKVNLAFATSKDYKPCSSGLPSDTALTSDQGLTPDQGLPPPVPSVPPYQPTQQAAIAPRITTLPGSTTPTRP